MTTRGLLLAILVLVQTTSAQPRLVIQGRPYFTGGMTLSITDPTGPGDLAWLVVGLGPLPLQAPVSTAIGPWYVTELLELRPLALIPAAGRLDVPFHLGREIPQLLGVHLVLQGFVGSSLTNPATIPLDRPYYEAAAAMTLASPAPAIGAAFGERVAVGDLNGDTFDDLVVGAWSEDVGSVKAAGRVYVLWGPGFTTSVALVSPTPIAQGRLGECLGIADVDGDQQVDLILPEGAGAYPIPPSAHGHLHVYHGGPGFSAAPSFSVSSAGAGGEYELFGRQMASGDFNDDGAADVAVGVAISTVSGFTYAGKVEVYWGPDLATSTDLFDPDPAQYTFFGDQLAVADATGDGVDDLIVGAPREPVGGVQSVGRVYVLAGPSLAVHAILDNPVSGGLNSRFGNGIAAGDLDGDSLPELVATDQNDHAVIFWSPDFVRYTVIDRPPSIYVTPEHSLSYGYSVLVGDTNGDGWGDVVVGDPLFAEASNGRAAGPGGAVFVALGPYYGTHHIIPVPTPEVGAEFGWHMALGELNGEPGLELVVSSPTGTADNLDNAGTVSLYTGH